MNSEIDNREIIYSADYNDYRTYCDICENFVCIDFIKSPPN